MKRTILLLLALLVLAVRPALAFGEILEFANDDGNVTHYKYTDKNGSVVFTDALAKIPDEYRKKNKLVRVGPPKKKDASAERKAALAESPPQPEAPPAPRFQVQPDPVPAGGESSSSYFWLLVLLSTIGAGVVGFVVYRRANENKRPAPRKQGDALSGRDRAPAHPADHAREHKQPHETPDVRSGPERTPSREQPEELLQRHLQARDFASAAKLCETAGDLVKAADLYLKAGLFAEAAANFEAGQDFFMAAETFLKAGNAERAAACFEQGGDPVKGYAALSRFSYDRGRVKEAAAYAEKAGDLMQAATMFQEEGEFARAGDLFFQAGFFAEAAENFSLAGDQARAAEAYERAGSYLQAAQAFETIGGDRERLAALYEKGEDFYPAGRLFVKLGQLDRALHVLQQVDPAAPDYPSASLLVGMIFLKRGLTDLAREKFLKIIDSQPVGKANLEPYYFLALCHEHAGDAAAARSIFAKILAEDYTYRDVRTRVAPK